MVTFWGDFSRAGVCFFEDHDDHTFEKRGPPTADPPLPLSSCSSLLVVLNTFLCPEQKNSPEQKYTRSPVNSNQGAQWSSSIDSDYQLGIY